MNTLYAVGIGAGNEEGMTLKAVHTLQRCEVICGYTGYIALIERRFPGKRFVATPMKQEIRRCEMALELAQKGVTTAMVCSGDAGVYAMASPIFELAQGKPVRVEVVAGVTAAQSGGLCWARRCRTILR